MHDQRHVLVAAGHNEQDPPVQVVVSTLDMIKAYDFVSVLKYIEYINPSK